MPNQKKKEWAYGSRYTFPMHAWKTEKSRDALFMSQFRTED